MMNKSLWLTVAALALAVTKSGLAQNAALVLVQPELSVVRKVLEADPQGSGLHGLSGAGKEILEDTMNVAVLIDDNGQWGSRHVGTNRVIAYRAGSATDRRYLEQALRSRAFRWLAHDGTHLITSQTLYAALDAPARRAKVAEYYNELAAATDVPPPVKNYLLTELGDALTQFSMPTRNAIIQESGNVAVMNDAIKRSESALEKLKANMLAAKSSGRTEAPDWLAELVNKSPPAAQEHFPLLVDWTLSDASAGTKLFKAELASGRIVWLETPATAKVDDPEEVLTTDQGKQLLQAGVAKLYFLASKLPGRAGTELVLADVKRVQEENFAPRN